MYSHCMHTVAMSSLLIIAILITAVSALTCPPQYQLMEDRCIRSISIEQSFSITTDLPWAHEKCGEDGAHLPMVRSDEENDVYRRIIDSSPYLKHRDVRLVMDLTCNNKTRRLEWIDGSPISFIPDPKVDLSFDCVSLPRTAVDDVDSDKWIIINDWDLNILTVLCVIEEGDPIVDRCGDYEPMTTATNSDKPCIKVFTEPSSWNSAEKQCSADFGTLVSINNDEENKFFWRSAISNGIFDGMHIGAHQSSSNPSIWTWIDGEVPITYKAFISGFPLPGAGECGAMLTETPSANWINEDCDDNQLPFICRRADLSSLSKNCPKDAPKAGEDIFPPGFPNSDTPCEYILYVAAKKLVQLEVFTLVAESNKDFLEILEGPAGPNLLANLTGTILTPNTFTTVKSNVLRVNWKPSGTGSKRGFRIQYNEVDP